jgi:hypothetical protein
MLGRSATIKQNQVVRLAATVELPGDGLDLSSGFSASQHNENLVSGQPGRGVAIRNPSPDVNRSVD